MFVLQEQCLSALNTTHREVRNVIRVQYMDELLYFTRETNGSYHRNALSYHNAVMFWTSFSLLGGLCLKMYFILKRVRDKFCLAVQLEFKKWHIATTFICWSIYFLN